MGDSLSQSGGVLKSSDTSPLTSAYPVDPWTSTAEGPLKVAKEVPTQTEVKHTVDVPTQTEVLRRPDQGRLRAEAGHSYRA